MKKVFFAKDNRRRAVVSCDEININFVLAIFMEKHTVWSFAFGNKERKKELEKGIFFIMVYAGVSGFGILRFVFWMSWVHFDAIELENLRTQEDNKD